MSPRTPRRERVYFLYGSQTGNSEQAALELSQQAVDQLSPQRLQEYAGSSCQVETLKIEPVHMQLDDFLELQHCQWTRLIVIVVSSYGVGQAPLGSWRFRELCDAWLQEKDNERPKDLLKGVHFALCGLGDSKYTTFFRNPTVIEQGLSSVGAVRVGPLGKADASGTGSELQSKVIDDWIASIWPHLAKVLVQEPPSQEVLDRMQQETLALCRKINPDFAPESATSKATLPLDRSLLLLGGIGAVMAVLLYVFLMMNQ